MIEFDYEWTTSTGMTSPELAATMGRLELRVGGLKVTEAYDPSTRGVRTGIYVAMLPIAEWLVENWWPLLYERRGTEVRKRWRPSKSPRWRSRHAMRSGREGFHLPDLVFMPGADGVLLRWTADRSAAALRFIGDGEAFIDHAALKPQLQSFIDAVFTRVIDEIGDSYRKSVAFVDWEAICSSDNDESRLCQQLARLGLDPYGDVDEAVQALGTVAGDEQFRRFEGLLLDAVDDVDRLPLLVKWLERVEQKVRAHSDALTRSEARKEAQRLKKLKKLRQEALSHGGLPAVDFRRPWEIGRDRAQWVMEQVGWEPQHTATDITTFLEQDVGWHRRDQWQVVGTGEQLEIEAALVWGDRGGPRLTSCKSLGKSSQRFRIARGLHDALFTPGDAVHQLWTMHSTEAGSTARAFAAQLLAPDWALAKHVPRHSMLSAKQVLGLARQFKVHKTLIAHQVENWLDCQVAEA